MQIQFSMEGGFAVFPGLSRPVSIDVDSLPSGAADTLRSAVDRSRFFDRDEAAPTAAKGAADQRQYVVTVDDGGRRRTLTIPESSDDSDLKTLVGALEEQRKAAQKR